MYSAHRGVDEKADEKEMQPGWKPQAGITAAGAICPVPGCGTLVVAYGLAESIYEVTRRRRPSREFICSGCGAEFTAPEKDLVFESVPRDWLLAEICHA